ncbi:MAG: polyprenol monophosphomannose synthase [Patescibacteria group bacterium]|nr:polyprenol monophosphomannose synthase [Patescibacteria group bacterium]MDD4303950.1 polyprenol monophosphomannose synthase [Patescibacteria group bacterium]MDD4695061.1 polyprenol monophosphomannose synthase [Patescibacteria group bacterium]
MVYIVIPTYKEKDNIGALIEKICEQDIEDLHILVVDDNSPDGTAEIVESLISKYPVEIIKRPEKLGLGSAYVAGFKYALSHNADMLMEMDADFSHFPNKIPNLIDGVKNGADMCLGSRRVKGGGVIGWSFKRKFMSRAAQDFSRLFLGLKTKDVTGGFRCYHKRVFDVIDLNNIKSNGYSFQEEMIYLLERNNFKIKEIPITFVDRQKGVSKLGFGEVFYFLVNMLRLKFKK